MQPTAMVGRLTSVVAGFVLGAIVAVSSVDRALAVAPSQEELGAARQFAAERLFSEAPEALPFSFVYDGTPSSQCLRDWGRSEQVERLESGRVSRTVVFRDPQTGLRVRCEAVIYKEFPTLEWTLYFENTGDEATGILEDVQALNAVWQGPSGEFLLHHALGSQASPSDYAPQETTLAAGANARFAPAGGRPSNGAWPYFNLQSGDRGVIVAVGWPGQWATQFQHNGGRGVRIAAGQELLRTKLLPGEEIRTPMVVLQFWHGTYIRSQNLWRRWMMAHGMPRPKGALPPPQFVASSSRAYEEMIHANEQNQIMHIDRYLEEELEIDYWWMDAGWYIQEHGWPQVGTWEIDRERFPRGFRPISKHAHAKGVKIIVWFEPERVMPGTWLYENHPESPAEEMRLELHGLDPDGEYLVTVFGVPGSRRIRGRELMGEGLRVILSQRPSAATILYEKQD